MYHLYIEIYLIDKKKPITDLDFSFKFLKCFRIFNSKGHLHLAIYLYQQIQDYLRSRLLITAKYLCPIYPLV